MNVVVMDVSPQQAQMWLENNKSNRTISDKAVHKYSEDMKAGRWQLTPQPISITECGQLADGQHRLMAVVQSGCTVKMTVAFGYENTIYDIGRTRSAADSFYFKTGERMHNICMAVPAVWIAVASNRDINSVTIEEKIEFVEKWHDEIIDAFVISRAGSSKALAKSTPCVIAIMVSIRCCVRAGDLELFFRCVNSGFPTDEDRDYSPAIALRNLLLSGRGTSRSHSLSYKMTIVCTACKMIEAFVNGEKRTIARETFNASYVNRIFPDFRNRVKENGW